ncbi:hypothetical protein [Spirosoma rhododendri]|uniref:Uncharacterized protein n=1 Tax=Spirosoma rhododendri TaxID=2728024 RepID=A0A7L5DJQ4_9BACT|nr:hypothetical protein [Spirosoma rhododendri]QJD77672.1 hypothetical protein HH216_04005 [Spirosoma rhododendri]
MILILCHLHDADAIWLYQRLKRASPPDSVRIVSVDELLYARTVRHTLDADSVEFRIQLQNGQTLTNDNISLVINRLYYIDPVVWKQTSPAQYQYVSQEINALYLSVLTTLDKRRLYNPPSASWLGGRNLTPAEWQLLGLRSGLSVPPGWSPVASPVLPDSRVLVIVRQLLGQLPDGVSPDACRLVAQQAGMPLLELQFVENQFVAATSFPAFHHYGDDLITHFLIATTNGTDLGHPERIAHPTFA